MEEQNGLQPMFGCPHDGRHQPLSRRKLLAGGGVALAATALGASVATPDAQAQAAAPERHMSAAPTPKPIPGGVLLNPEDPESRIHWYLPGPTTAVSPVIGLQGQGLDVEPSSITDFDGKIAFAIVSGEAQTTDGPQLIEFDIRVMEGDYIAENGERAEAAFAFF